MVFFNYALRKLNAKIVYYGPGLCGKTTNLVWIHDHFEGGERGKMISLATEGDRTIFFDLLPLEIGSIRGMDVTLQLYTVPGQVHYNSTRQLVLRGADGVVFVADSQRAMQGSNVDSFKNLQENLLLQGISLDGFPHVLQFNKRDLRDVVPVEELNDELNHYSVPIFEATATEGVGVQETLEGIVKLVMRNLRQRYEGATTGARTPGVEDSQVSVPEAPPTPPPVEPVTPPDAPAEPIPISEPPPVEPVAPPESPPVFDPEPPPVEPVVPPEPEPPAEPAPIEAPAEVALSQGDPAETVDFSQAMGSDPFGGLGGGFEDEVSTAVYDVNDDSAIDFEELKALDEQKAAPTPPPAPEPPPAEPSDFDIVSPGYEPAPAEEATEPAPPAFDLESTDAGLKTQEATSSQAQDSMAAFDFGAAPPDMDSIPDFELDVPEPEPEPAAPEIEVEVIPETVEAEPTPAPETPAAVDAPPAVTEETPGVADAVETSAPPRPPAEGMYIDRIEAPSPFAPNPEAPGGSAEALQALGAIADEEPVIVPEEREVPVAAAVDEVVEVVEPAEPPPVASFDEDFESPPVIDVDAEIAAPPVIDADAEFEAPPVEEVADDIEAPSAAPDEDFFELPPEAEDEVAIDVSAESAVHDQLFEATPAEPVVVGDEDPWTEEELSGVYDLAEVEKAEQAAAIEAAESRPVEVSAEDNQLHLRLQGTGAIVESGQVRALDIEVPVPGSWVGNRRVTLQLRLTLTPATEDEDDGNSPS
jgi:signal recognition particle receptor subunit beta